MCLPLSWSVLFHGHRYHRSSQVHAVRVPVQLLVVGGAVQGDELALAVLVDEVRGRGAVAEADLASPGTTGDIL